MSGSQGQPRLITKCLTFLSRYHNYLHCVSMVGCLSDKISLKCPLSSASDLIGTDNEVSWRRFLELAESKLKWVVVVMVGVVTGDRMLGCNQLMLIPGDCQFVIRGPGSGPVEGGAWLHNGPEHKTCEHLQMEIINIPVTFIPHYQYHYTLIFPLLRRCCKTFPSLQPPISAKKSKIWCWYSPVLLFV